MKAVPILGVVLAFLSLTTPAEAQYQNPDARVSLRVEGRALDEVVQYLREQSGFNIVVVEGGDTQVSLDVTDVAWKDALELVAELAGCVVEERTAGVLVLDRPPRVDFAFDNAELTQVIDTIGKLSGANIVVAPEVAGTLTLRLSNVPWRDALNVSVKTLGYVVVEEERGILRVVDPLSLQAQMETHSYQLRYVRPSGTYAPVIVSEFIKGELKGASGDLSKDFPVIEALKKALSQGGDLDYIATQNVIIVRDTAQVHASISEMLERIDVEPSQVFVDVKFVSSANNDLFSLGVDYGDLGPQVSFGGSQIPITFPFNLGQGGFEDDIIAHPTETGPFASDTNAGNTLSPATIFGALSFTQFAATLRMLQSDTSTDIVQAPKIFVLDGEPATIFVGETIRYAEAQSEQGQAGGLQLSIKEAKNSPVDVGFQLLVIPHVIPGSNKISMEVIPKETSLTGTGNTAVAPPGFDVFTIGASGLEGSIALPRKRTSTIMSTMMVDSGSTAVIGGLTTENLLQKESRVPFISRIPIIGWLFKFEETSAEKRSLMVFLTPTIVRSNSDTQRILHRELERRREQYGDKIDELLFPEGVPSYEEPTKAKTVGNMDTYQWATFVQNPTGSAGDSAFGAEDAAQAPSADALLGEGIEGLPAGGSDDDVDPLEDN